MGNSYTAPSLQKQKTAVEELQPKENLMDTSIGRPAEKSAVVMPVDVYKASIDNLTKLLAGEYSGSLEECTKFQQNFIKNLEPMLNLDEPLVKQILDYFIITIVRNRDTYNYNNLLRPCYPLEGKMNANDLSRYKRFLDFITCLADNAKDRPRFIANFDVVKFASMFSPKVKQTLTNYIYR